VLIGGLYLPNGNPCPGPRFDYKMRWIARLMAHADELLAAGLPAVLAGDFNIIPTERDVYVPERWLDDALFAPEARAAYVAMWRAAGPMRCAIIIPRRSTPSGSTCGTPMAAMRGCASTICC
jgi:exonuclease III